jgi:pyruvate formate lyase activating enzyme
MIIGGFQKFSLIDYPGKISAIIFTIGCNFRCPYCHNPKLIIPEKKSPKISLLKIYNFLEKRRGKLDAVSITGGEPTLHTDLPEIIGKIKKMGFLVKLDSNGTRPEMLKYLIDKKLVDYLAMDIKAPLEDYSKITGNTLSIDKLKKSIDLIIDSEVKYEFRTTIVKSLTSKDDLRKIAQTIKGAENYYLQRFIPTEIYDPSLVNEVSYSDLELKELSQELEVFVKSCNVR